MNELIVKITASASELIKSGVFRTHAEVMTGGSYRASDRPLGVDILDMPYVLGKHQVEIA